MRPTYDHPEVEHARSIPHEACKVPNQPTDLNRLHPAIRQWFNPTLVYAGNAEKERIDFKETQLMPVYVACFDIEGKTRKNDRGSFIGMREALALLWMNPYHGRGGTARSNQVFHGLAKTEKKVMGERKRSPELRRVLAKADKELIKLFRDSR